MNIRQAIAAINAARPAGRKPVRANSANEAQEIKFRWGVIDSIRTLAKRVNFLAEAMDKAEAKAPDLERTMRQGAIKAAHNKSAAMFGNVPDVLAQFTATKTRLEAERDAELEAAIMDRISARNVAAVTYGTRMQRARDKYDDSYRAYWAADSADRMDYESFRLKVVTRYDARVRLAEDRYRADCKAAEDRFAAVRKDAHEFFAAQLEAAEFLMWSQLRAVRDGKPLPTADNCPGLMTVDDEGNILTDPDPEGEKLFAMWQVQRAPGEFG